VLDIIDKIQKKESTESFYYESFKHTYSYTTKGKYLWMPLDYFILYYQIDYIREKIEKTKSDIDKLKINNRATNDIYALRDARVFNFMSELHESIAHKQAYCIELHNSLNHLLNKCKKIKFQEDSPIYVGILSEKLPGNVLYYSIFVNDNIDPEEILLRILIFKNLNKNLCDKTLGLKG
jgi:hypothetical protein